MGGAVGSVSAGAGFKYSLASDDGGSDFWGLAREAKGLFCVSEDGFRQVDLLGCAPRGGLLAALDHVGGHRAHAGNADLALLDAEGVEMGSYFVNDVTPIAVKTSTLGAGVDGHAIPQAVGHVIGQVVAQAAPD